MSLSRIRLDPIETLRELRAYAEPVDTSLPLDAMTKPFVTSGLVTLVGEYAYVSMIRGAITRPMRSDFYRDLAQLGIRHVIWRRVDPHGGMRRNGHELPANV